MRLEEVRVEQCRNIEGALLRPDEELTVMAGRNGQGKTNLLECIFLLTGGKSFRGARDADLVRRGEAFGRVTGTADTGRKKSAIDILIESGQAGRRGRTAKVNGVDYGRASGIAGLFTAVVFEPNHLSLVKAGPEGRRRFLDAALCQLYPGYIAILRRFARALAQKNALLRRWREVRDAGGQLDAFDAELAQSGAEITRRRAEWLAEAGRAAEQFYAELADGAERLSIRFAPSAPPGGLAAALGAARDADLRAGFSTAGPQREDFEIALCGQSARVYGSQGQQRSCVLALKLAEAEAARQCTGQHPVLLLDDVLSELDDVRQAYLLGRMKGKQSFVTCCDAAAFRAVAGKLVYVSDGEVREER